MPEAFTVAIPAAVLLQIPPVVPVVKGVVLFTQTIEAPVIGDAAGKLFTVMVTTFSVAAQPIVVAIVTLTLSPFNKVLLL